MRNTANDRQPVENRNPTTDSQEPCRGSVRLRGGRITRIPDIPFLTPAHAYAIPAHIPAIPIVANKDSKTPDQAKTELKRLISDHREIQNLHKLSYTHYEILKLATKARGEATIKLFIKIAAITDVALCICILAGL